MATLVDEVGIDVAYHVAQFLMTEFGQRSVSICDVCVCAYECVHTYMYKILCGYTNKCK